MHETQNEQMRRLSDNIHREELAKQILDNPIYQETIELLEQLITEAFFDTKAEDVRALQVAKIYHSVFKQFHNNFVQIIQTGEMSKIDIANLTNEGEIQ